MSEKRYQVFVSSTYLDLQDERRRVVEALLQIDCIPVGMELFPATDDEQWKFIRGIIDECDYYVLIIAGRYGTLTEEGISFTEREFDYAKERGIPVLAFLHANPGIIISDKRELDKEAIARLEAFKERVRTGRMVKTWSTSEELASNAVVSLTRAFNSHPARGWIRGGGPDALALLQELNELRRKSQELEQALGQYKARARVESAQLAGGNEAVNLCFKYSATGSVGTKETREWSQPTTWNRILSIIGPAMLNQWQPEFSVGERLAAELARGKIRTSSISDWSLDTVKVQLLALGLIEVKSFPNRSGAMSTFWMLTSTGQGELLAIRSIRKQATETLARGEEAPNRIDEAEDASIKIEPERGQPD